MSLDFLVGFTIFMLALIMVVSMVPGLLVGLQSSSIDYDAVAYRTGVILAEDPGWPVYPPWEMKTEAYKDEIERMGLAASKETPNILLSTKVDAFFNSFFEPEDYRSKAIFGDIPYSYSFSLSSGGTLIGQTDDTPPTNHSYGYIRRAVLIKEPGVAEIVGSATSPYRMTIPPEPVQTFTVRLNFSQLLDPKRGPAYRIDPRTEPVNVTITNFIAYNTTNPDNAKTLQNITFWKMDPTVPMPRFTRIPFSYSTEDPDLYTLYLDENPSNLTPEANVSNSISLVLKPPATSRFTLDQNSVLDIRFTFENTTINGTFLYDYDHVDLPALKPAVLEVAIW